MNTTKKIIWINTFRFGVFTGVVYIIPHLFYFFRNLTNTPRDYSGNIQFIILVAGIIWLSLRFRKEFNNGAMSYAQGLGIGTLLGLFSGLVFALYLYVIYLLCPVCIDNLISTIEEKLITDSGFNDDQIEALIEVYRRYLSPGVLAFGTVINFAFLGFIISLVTSLFIKKQPASPFDSAMSEIS